jgi:hypothetical protein
LAIISTSAAYQLTPEQKNRIIGELGKRGAIRGCDRCGNPTLSVLDFIFSNIPASADMQRGLQFAIGSAPAVPTIAIACPRCGSVYYFFLAMLVPLEEFGFGK